MDNLAKVFRTIADGLADPMPQWAFCGVCGLILINTPGVREMVANRIGEDRVAEPPTCRCEEDAAIAIRRRYRLSGVPHQFPGDAPKMLDNFVERQGATDAFVAAEAFASSEDSPAVVLTIVGDTGRGKSHLAEAICRDALGRGFTARYEYVPDLLDRMRATFNSDQGENIEDIITLCVQVKILVLDDLGMEKGSDFTQERLTSIVEQRMARHAKTAVTTNKTHDDLYAKGYERLASRLWAVGTHEAIVRNLTCGDARIEGVSSAS